MDIAVVISLITMGFTIIGASWAVAKYLLGEITKAKEANAQSCTAIRERIDRVEENLRENMERLENGLRDAINHNKTENSTTHESIRAEMEAHERHGQESRMHIHERINSSVHEFHEMRANAREELGALKAVVEILENKVLE